MPTVLVVDDERQIAQIARDYLEHAGFTVVVAADGAKALDLARSRRPDLIVLDLALPAIDGLEVARVLRRESDVPIIMLTARVEGSDRLAGLEIGADDYVTKPFSPRELVARVKAVLRRSDVTASRGDVFTVSDLTFDVPKVRLTRGLDAIELTATEFQLLATLARQPGPVFTRGPLLDAIHGLEVHAFERAIDPTIKKIRRKIEPDTRNPIYVLTVYGIGYKFADA